MDAVFFQILKVHCLSNGASPNPIAKRHPGADCRSAWVAGAWRQKAMAVADRMLARVMVAIGILSRSWLELPSALDVVAATAVNPHGGAEPLTCIFFVLLTEVAV
jgi:hypothetical protein